jgi:hypothetical protein
MPASVGVCLSAGYKFCKRAALCRPSRDSNGVLFAMTSLSLTDSGGLEGTVCFGQEMGKLTCLSCCSLTTIEIA